MSILRRPSGRQRSMTASMTGCPARRIAFGADQQRHAAHFLRGRHATFGGAQEKPSAKAASLDAAIDAETARSRTDETFAVAGRVRREDVLVHLALMQFP